MKKIIDWIKNNKIEFLKSIGLLVWGMLTVILIIGIYKIPESYHSVLLNDDSCRITLLDTDLNKEYDSINVILSNDDSSYDKIDVEITTSNGDTLYKGEINDDNMTYDLIKKYPIATNENAKYDLILKIHSYYKWSTSSWDYTYKIKLHEDTSAYIQDWDLE